MPVIRLLVMRTQSSRCSIGRGKGFGTRCDIHSPSGSPFEHLSRRRSGEPRLGSTPVSMGQIFHNKYIFNIKKLIDYCFAMKDVQKNKKIKTKKYLKS